MTVSPTTSPPARRTRAAFHTLTVASVDRLTDDAVAVAFDVPAGLRGAYGFRPGQSLTLRRTVDGCEHRRSYSICAAAGERPRIGVREIPGGLFSTWLVHEVRPGDRIDVGTPGGALRADPSAAGRHLLIAAGSGITPLLSIASSVLAHPDARATLIYGNRTTGSVMFAEDLADLKNRYGPRFDLVHVLSREPRDVELFSGRLDPGRLRRLLTALVPLGALDHVWLCGPFGMIAGARDVLAELGVAPGRVHAELFHVDGPPPELHRADSVAAGATSDVTIVLDGRATTAALPRDRPILDGAQAVRGDLPFACKGGVCGTCRARLIAGEAGMRRNYALDDAELAHGFVLTCQAMAASDAVTVDFDQ
ncbi:1,2-phenylacetyl-CoA epoxidase subunit PaaE [Nocardiopsis sediminis]|uniref:1,2-phenylacetyl-CoA epoxidase subunit PaaE n=1 Tax=Nocardiopsis sediminis TaxID=1778267 RepID=A0ABV8FWV1_9ACTN